MAEKRPETPLLCAWEGILKIALHILVQEQGEERGILQPGINFELWL